MAGHPHCRRPPLILTLKEEKVEWIVQYLSLSKTLTFSLPFFPPLSLLFSLSLYICLSPKGAGLQAGAEGGRRRLSSRQTLSQRYTGRQRNFLVVASFFFFSFFYWCKVVASFPLSHMCRPYSGEIQWVWIEGYIVLPMGWCLGPPK